MRIRFVAVSLKSTQDHSETAVRHDRTLQWGFGLQTYDYFIFAIDVAWGVRGDRSGNLRDVEDAFLAFFDK